MRFCFFCVYYSEVLNNDYHSITSENWNQTLRKAKGYYQSWAGARIRALYDGEYQDQITNLVHTWKRNEKIGLDEIVALKVTYIVCLQYYNYTNLYIDCTALYRF